MRCRHNDQNSIDNNNAGITSNIYKYQIHCRTFAKGASINLQDNWIGAGMNTKTPIVKVSFTQPAPTGTTVKQEAGYLVTLSFSTCKKSNSESYDRKCESVI